MPYTYVNNITMYYEETGAGQPLILSHGAIGSIDQPDSSWSEMAPVFSEYYHTIQIEHRGHGRHYSWRVRTINGPI